MSTITIGDRQFVEATDRNEHPRGHSHLYLEVNGPNESDVAATTGLGTCSGYLPMCRYGWNRSDGADFSILRGHRGQRGLCKVCQQRAHLGLPGVEARPGSHKTKWI
jgi:hypothetical protein